MFLVFRQTFATLLKVSRIAHPHFVDLFKLYLFEKTQQNTRLLVRFLRQNIPAVFYRYIRKETSRITVYTHLYLTSNTTCLGYTYVAIIRLGIEP
jgi:hypothetical protein